VKQVPNAFLDTGLGELVDAAGAKDVIIAGFMTHMCVAFTAQVGVQEGVGDLLHHHRLAVGRGEGDPREQ
jgi:nicotinamidase-related amidase